MSEARIIELEYDAIRKKVSSVVIGDYEYNYFNDVSSATEIIKNVVNPDGTLMAERVQGILNGVYTQLRLQSTAAQKVDGVAFKVEELDDESPLYGCMIWGTQGIQISTTRTADGKDWDWTTAITAKGIVANAIVTGLLSDKTGNNYWDLDTGEFRLSPTTTVGNQEIATKNNTISSVDVEYASGTSNTTPPETGWSTNSPEWQEGRYIWQRTVTTMQDGTQNISDPTCIQGAAGENEATGIGVSQIIEQYYLSTSSTTQTGGAWSTAQPAWEKGKYIWTRSQITWTDDSVTYTDPVLAKAINGANEAVDDLDTSLDQQEVFNRLTNNGQAQGIILQNGQLYINAEYIQSLILKVGGVNNENGTFEVYNGSGVLVGKIDKDGAKFTNGNDWLQIKNSLMTGGYGGTTDGLLDLSANYSGGERHVVLESKTGDVILKSANEFKVERPSVGQGILVQSGSADFIEEGIEIIFDAVTPLAAIALAKSVSKPYLVLKTWDGSDGYDRYEFLEGDAFSYSAKYALVGFAEVTINCNESVAPNATSNSTWTISVPSNLRSPSYRYTYAMQGMSWLNPYNVTFYGSPYYQLSCRFVNIGSQTHTGSVDFIIYAWAER